MSPFEVEINLVYDNTTLNPELKTDWGFACIIRTASNTVLFDAGGNGAILLHNMEKLGISPAEVDTVFLSHNHFDHIGGLSEFLNKNNDVRIITPPSLRGIRNAREIIYPEQAGEVAPDLITTGELNGIEQSLLIRTVKGFVIVTGCSHPGVLNILKAAKPFGKVHALIGGLHGFKQFDLLRDIPVICPTHCTKHIKTIRELYPAAYREGGVGQALNF